MWVCDVAEAVAHSVLKTAGPHAFAYRGADLERAFKRSVYFQLINDARAREIFATERGGMRARPFEGSGATDEILAAYLSGRITTSRRTGGGLRAAARALGRGLRIASRPGRSKELWAVAIQPKFVSHLHPFLHSLEVPVSVVTFDDPPTDARAQELGLTSLNAGAGKETRPRRRVPNALGVVCSHALAFDAIYERMRAERPAGIVLSEGNAPVYDLVNEAARLLGIPAVCVQQGWSPIVHTGFRALRFSTMVVWGEWFANALAPFNPDQRFVALGHHLIELAPPKAHEPRSVGFFLQRGSRLISEEVWQGMLSLAEFCARELPQARVLVREHPNGPLTPAERARLGALPAVRFVPPAEVALRSVLEQCDVVVSVFSTTILEGIGAGAVPLVVNATSMPSYYPDVAAEGAGIEVKDFAAARQALRRLWSGGFAQYAPRIEALQRHLFACGGEEARLRIVAHLKDEFGLGSTADGAQR